MKKIKLLLVAVAIVLLHTDCSKNKNTIEDTPISETIDTKDVFKKLTINGFDSKDVSITIIGDSINVVVPYDTDLTKVKNTFDLPKGAKSDPASGEEVDFSSRTVPYIVEYEDTSKDTVKISMKKTVSIAGSIDVSGVFDGFEIYKNDIKIEDTTIDMTTEGLISIKTPYNTDLTSIKNTFTLPEGATSSPASGENVDFSTNSTNQYTVTYSDGSSEMFDITVVNREPTETMADTMNANDVFSSFEAHENSVKIEDAIIDITTESTINITTPHGTDLSLISNVFALASGATSSPASGENVDFSTNSTNQYTVTYSDGSSEMFNITVVNREPSMADTMNANDVFSSFETHENSVKIEDAIIDIAIESTINITTPYGTDLSLISNVFALASGATLSPVSGENVDFSTNSTNQYTVTYSDGSSEMFNITVVNREP
ncbi:MAG: hypothetical protein HRT66_02835, partial [Flavobacteriaceae bacterium]|nr:hypothetical protein [Flavobacteriaceae bacterium]